MPYSSSTHTDYIDNVFSLQECSEAGTQHNPHQYELSVRDVLAIYVGTKIVRVLTDW